MGYVMKTKNGYDYYEAMSAFQKSIRRCDEDQTVFWGIELYESNYIGHLWNRIYIIVHEDIGLANPDMTSRINGYKSSYDYLEVHRPKKISKRLVFLQMLIDLARSPKSRYVDLSYSVYWSKHQERVESHQVPDFAFDMHTRKGKKMGRGLEHFYTEGALTNNNAGISGEKEFEKLAWKIDEETSGAPKQINEPKSDLFTS